MNEIFIFLSLRIGFTSADRPHNLSLSFSGEIWLLLHSAVMLVRIGALLIFNEIEKPRLVKFCGYSKDINKCGIMASWKE